MKNEKVVGGNAVPCPYGYKGGLGITKFYENGDVDYDCRSLYRCRRNCIFKNNNNSGTGAANGTAA